MGKPGRGWPQLTPANGRARLVYGCSIAVVSVILAACGGGGDAPTTTGGGVPTSTGGRASAEGYPVTIENCGHALRFDKPPSRVVLPIHPMAEIFVGLGLADRAIGRVAFSEQKEKKPPILPEQAADFARIPVVSDTPYPPPKERMLSLRPDFLLAYGDFDYGGQHQGADGLATLDELKSAGVQAYTVVCPDEAGDYTDENLEATYRTILDLGTIFGVSDRAEERVAAMKAQIADVSEKVRGEPKVKVIAYDMGEGPLHLLGGRASIITQMIEAAGGENVFAENKPYFQASLEAVVGKHADAFLVIASFAAGTRRLDGTKETQFLFTTFPNIQASKDRRVAITTYAYTNPGWRVAQTVEDIARQLHPNAFDQPSDTHQYTDPNG